ncbi:sensor histidine kinase [Actinomadura sp. PM05-2]|uniref:Oxygen sensor histidine kinase NreB n=2 Tax=Actinomadura parmotrematis TaxID=2864039 RepID=A0ABS7G3J2_9ACTN|nr:sensor histidine kinase [Actinomadura parmotrematis]
MDAFERRENRILLASPYVVVGATTAIALLNEHPSAGRAAATLGAAAALLAWVAGFVTLRRGRPLPGPAAYAFIGGVLALLGVLITLDPMFGFVSILAYSHLQVLPPRGRLPGVVPVAALAALSQVGGPGSVHGTVWAVYAAVFAVNVALAGSLCYFLWRGDEESQRRRAVIEELAEANARLEEMMRENAGLHAQLLVQAREAGVHDERQRMAGEIHDTIAQGLAGVVTQLQAARQAHGRGGDWLRHLDLAQEMARGGLAEARRSVHALRPAALEEAALPDALAGVTARWSELHRVPAEMTTTGTVRAMHPEVEGTLLRTAQEALANVAKHAGASRVAVTLSYMGDQVTLDVRDDGAGFAPDRPRGGSESGGYGLAAMRRRVARVAGTLAVESEPGAGTAVSASVPAVPAAGGGA